jgi:hypothetical protein
MKIFHEPSASPGSKSDRASREQNGMATIIFIALLAIMMILVTAEARALFQLHREVKFLEQQQIERLNHATTPAPAILKTESK